eukprot:6127468-Pyramimonas_sp.AAC.1
MFWGVAGNFDKHPEIQMDVFTIPFCADPSETRHYESSQEQNKRTPPTSSAPPTSTEGGGGGGGGGGGLSTAQAGMLAVRAPAQRPGGRRARAAIEEEVTYNKLIEHVCEQLYGEVIEDEAAAVAEEELGPLLEEYQKEVSKEKGTSRTGMVDRARGPAR